MGLFGPDREATRVSNNVTRQLREQREAQERADRRAAAEKAERERRSNPKCRADKTVLRDKPGKRR